MEQIIQQAPKHISIQSIQDIYIKNSSNVIDTLVELWDIKEEKKQVSEEQQKWNEIRNTCDSFDTEMYKQIKGMANNSIENKPLKNVSITQCDKIDECCECNCTYDNDINE